MKSIEVLKSRLSNSNTLKIQNEGGFVSESGFEWKTPATAGEIQDFETKYGITMPNSFKDFLKITNGATLFKDVLYGQWGCKIHGLDEMIDVTNQVNNWGYNLKQGWLVFATWLGDCDILVFDLNKNVAEGNSYIIDGEQGERMDDWINIRGDFSKWIDRLIVAQGAKYWRWY